MRRARADAGAPGLESPASVPAAPAPLPPPPPPPPAPRAADPGVSSFGLATLGKLVKMLGKDSYIFTDPVNAKFVPDYYDIIHNPICLNQIRGRLQGGEYASMASLYEVGAGRVGGRAGGRAGGE